MAPDSSGRPIIFVDADACPVKREIYRVASRYGLRVILISNSWMRFPDSDRIELVVVEKGEGVADDWIAVRSGAGDIVITGDIPLASRCIGNGSAVIGNTGRPFTVENIGEVLATRNLFADLREQGMIIHGPSPFDARDRSRFLQAMDETVNRILRLAGSPG
jgi:uncharacterized protein